MPRPWSRPHASATRLPSPVLARFTRDQDGATAVEFGILALPFLFMVFAILELALVFWSSQVLETAVANASRLVYTGQFQGSAGSSTPAELAAKFKTTLCSNVAGLFDCSKVAVDIRRFAYGDAIPSVVNNGVLDTSAFGYQSVPPNTVALVTAAMEYPTFVKMLAGSAPLSNGNRVIMATTTFKTEPY